MQVFSLRYTDRFLFDTTPYKTCLKRLAHYVHSAYSDKTLLAGLIRYFLSSGEFLCIYFRLRRFNDNGLRKIGIKAWVRFAPAISTGQRNKCIKSLCWCFKLQRIARPFNKLPRDLHRSSYGCSNFTAGSPTRPLSSSSYFFFFTPPIWLRVRFLKNLTSFGLAFLRASITPLALSKPT